MVTGVLIELFLICNYTLFELMDPPGLSISRLYASSGGSQPWGPATSHHVYSPPTASCGMLDRFFGRPALWFFFFPFCFSSFWCRSHSPRVRRCCRPLAVAAQVDLLSTLKDGSADPRYLQASSNRLHDTTVPSDRQTGWKRRTHTQTIRTRTALNRQSKLA